MRGILRRLGQRLLASLPALLGVVVLTFLLMRVLPGDPAVFFASGPSAGQAEIENLRREMGLDRPIPVQLVHYLGDVARGNLGRSLTTGQPVLADLKRRLPASLELTFSALLLALSLALPLGILAALRPGSVVDHAVRLVCTLGVCVPTFVSGLLLIYVFYYLLGIAPDPTGRIDIFAASPPELTGFLLVDFALVGDWEAGGRRRRSSPARRDHGAVRPAPLARMTRASMLAVLGSDFVRTARSLGLSETRVIRVYALRNALIPVLTIAGIVFSTMLGANVLVEKVFSWPGVASYALDALLASDYAPVQGFVLLMASIFVMLNLTVDVLYGIADPRVSADDTRRSRILAACCRQPGHRHRRGRGDATRVAAAIRTLIMPYDPLASNVPIALQAPSAAHWAGTDQLGRDILSRLLAAARLDLAIAASAVSLSFAVGAVIGAWCGYTGGKVDRAVGRVVDVLMAFPLFVLAMAMVAALGNRVENIILATAVINLPFYIRFARAEVNIRRDAGWVEAARACGDSHLAWCCASCCPTCCRPWRCRSRSTSAGRS